MIDKETITLFSQDGSQASREEVAMMAKMLLDADEKLINAAINLRASERSAAEMAEGEAKWCARASQLEKELQALRLPDVVPNALLALCENMYDSKSTGASVADDIWQDCRDEMRLTATAPQPVKMPNRIANINLRSPLEVEDMWRDKLKSAVRTAGYQVEE